VQAGGDPGGLIDVQDFYDGALSFVDFLVGRYRQTAMNDLLAAFAEAGSLDEAYRRVFRQSYQENPRGVAEAAPMRRRCPS